jgi:hypothetical protein
MLLTPKSRDLDPFWFRLDADTQRWIAQNPVLISRHLKHWRHINHLTLLGPDAQDEAGNPLFDDPVNDPFLAREYPPVVTDILKEYGLATLESTDCLRLLKMHFNSPELRQLTRSRTKELHSALARLLLKPLADDERSGEIKSLPLLQLRDGTLVSAASETVYFPTVGDVDIPENLDLRILDNSARYRLYPRELYQQLGVLEATVVQVRNLIFQTFSSSKELSLREIKNYLRFLYLTHQSCEAGQPYSVVKVMTLEMTIKKPWNSIVYLPGMDHPYAPQKLIGLGIFGLSHPLDYLHPEILKDAPKQPSPVYISWKQWLCSSIGVRETLSFFESKTHVERRDISSTTEEVEVLSEHVKYVLKNRPDKFLGLLQHLWASEGPQLLKSPSLVSEIQELSAKGLCGLDRPVKIRDTWLPVKKLKDCVKRYMEYPEKFPFLKLEDAKDMDQVLSAKWSFLTEQFGVNRENNMDLVLGLLDSIMQTCNGVSTQQVLKVIGLYNDINAALFRCTSEDKDRAL